MSEILVVGSLSTDFVVETNRIPEIGETIEGQHFQTNFGGKGANQAVACARLGARTTLFGAVGEDVFGERLLKNLTENGVSIDQIVKMKHESTGSAFITLVAGDNTIIYIAGANEHYTAEKLFQTKEQLNILKSSDIVLIQNETPKATVEKLISTCHEYAIPLLYNPAPARVLKKEWIDKLTFLTPNETEFKTLFPEQPIDEILRKYPNKLIVTLGAKGAKFHSGKEVVHVPASTIDTIVDTTGAGDTFNGAFAVAYTSGNSIEKSIRFANRAASLSVQKSGAQKGMPRLEDLQND